MKALVIGLGSMGKRRVRNLRALGIEAIAGTDPREDRRQEAAAKYGVETFSDVDAALASKPDAVVISTPPDLHLGFAARAVEVGAPFFTEAGVPDAQLPSLLKRMSERGVVGMPSCTMRFYPGPKGVMAWLGEGAIGRPYAWMYQSGQYLPDWHPWESIQSFYVSRRVTGACREIVPFELTWLTKAFGAVIRVACQKDKLSDLPADIDDIYQLQLRHQDGVVGQLTVDVLARAAVRHFRAIGSDGVIEWDNGAKRLRLYRAAEGAWTERSLETGTVESGYLNPEEPYIEEMSCFLECARTGRQPDYTFEDDRLTLAILLAAERSAANGAAATVEL